MNYWIKQNTWKWGGGLAKQQSTFPVYVKPWIDSPAPKEEKTRKGKRRREGRGEGRGGERPY